MGRLGMFEPPTLFKKPTPCKSCGYKGLYWQKHQGQWRLHHYTMLEGETKTCFVLHRCGFDSWGRPKPILSGATS